MDKQKLSIELFFRFLIATLIIFGLLNSLNCRIYFLIIAGFLSGTYYGWFNDDIWNAYEKELSKKARYRVHQLWVHIVCGLIGALALYAISTKVSHSYFFVNKFNAIDLLLTLFSILGYTGLLPSLLWFFSRKGDIKG